MYLHSQWSTNSNSRHVVHLWSFKSLDNVKVSPNHLNHNLYPQASHNIGGSFKISHSLSKILIGWWASLKTYEDSSGHPMTLTLVLDPQWLVQVMIHLEFWPYDWGPLISKLCSCHNPLNNLKTIRSRIKWSASYSPSKHNDSSFLFVWFDLYIPCHFTLVLFVVFMFSYFRFCLRLFHCCLSISVTHELK